MVARLPTENLVFLRVAGGLIGEDEWAKFSVSAYSLDEFVKAMKFNPNHEWTILDTDAASSLRNEEGVITFGALSKVEGLKFFTSIEELDRDPEEIVSEDLEQIMAFFPEDPAPEM